METSHGDLSNVQLNVKDLWYNCVCELCIQKLYTLKCMISTIHKLRLRILRKESLYIVKMSWSQLKNVKVGRHANLFIYVYSRVHVFSKSKYCTFT